MTQALLELTSREQPCTSSVINQGGDLSAQTTCLPRPPQGDKGPSLGLSPGASSQMWKAEIAARGLLETCLCQAPNQVLIYLIRICTAS